MNVPEFLWKVVFCRTWKTWILELKRVFESEISLDEAAKFINLGANDYSSGNDDLTAEFHKHFSIDVSFILLDVYDSWENLGSMGAISRTGTISITYKFRL